MNSLTPEQQHSSAASLRTLEAPSRAVSPSTQHDMDHIISGAPSYADEDYHSAISNGNNAQSQVPSPIIGSGNGIARAHFTAMATHILSATKASGIYDPNMLVAVRADDHVMAVYPIAQYQKGEPATILFEQAAKSLNAEICVSISTDAIQAALNESQQAEAVQLNFADRIQILESIEDIEDCSRNQFAAFVRNSDHLLVWSDDAETMVSDIKSIHEKVLNLAFKSYRRDATRSRASSVYNSPRSGLLPSASVGNLSLRSGDEGSIFEDKMDFSDEAKGANQTAPAVEPPRPRRTLQPFYVGASICLAIVLSMLGPKMVISQVLLSGNYIYFALLIFTPALFCLSWFFCMNVIGALSRTIGPISPYHHNSSFYSAIKPTHILDPKVYLPHVTITMPVYKEGLEDTIAPSIRSLRKSMQTYARQGGTSNILVCDDGLQLISKEDMEARRAFYHFNQIAFVARPGHSNEAGGFQRAGRFKKASNINFAWALSDRVEEILEDLELESEQQEAMSPGSAAGKDLYSQALQMAVDESFERQKGQAWAAGNIRMGEIVLIVDSDTLAPEDCFLDAANEFAHSPECAIIQHHSSVMLVSSSFFEHGIAFFTTCINTSIAVSTSLGEIAPFIGHNAFLRWSAVQEVGLQNFKAENDGAEPRKGDIIRYWSESHVSEDFEMAISLITLGYQIRWATYSNGGFAEGVSLSVEDEVNRWQKYAYGCSELLFNPLKTWWHRLPVTKMMRNFIWSNAPLHYKFSSLAYIFSYWALAIALPLSVSNYFLVGEAFTLSGFYLPSFDVLLSCLLVFTAAGSLSYNIFEYRAGTRGLFRSILRSTTWLLFFFLFFAGISIHIDSALLCHFFSINISWSSTVKSLSNTSFFAAWPQLCRRFWGTYVICITLTAAIIVLSTPIVPLTWRITEFAAIFPLALSLAAHLVLPIFLNPDLLRAGW